MKRDAPPHLLVDKHLAIRPLSGQKARRFRARWAASATHAEPTIRTLKFPLEGQGRIDASAFARLDSTLRDLRPGCLPWLLLTVHASGFRIFSKADEVIAFMNANRFDDVAYRQALQGSTGMTCTRLGPVHLYLRFRRVPRPIGGAVLPFNHAVIAREYTRYFRGQAKTGPDPTTVMLLSHLARRLERLGGWAQLASHPTRGFEAWDEVMRLEGVPVPPLAPRMRDLVHPHEAVAKATIAFDRARLRMAEPTLPLIVATALLEARADGFDEPAALTQRVLQTLLTDSYSGLSWLWGAGLCLLKRATVSECREWFGADEECAAALTLAAKCIPPDRVLGEDGYAPYRADVGGMLASWIRRYVERLREIDAKLRQYAPRDKSGGARLIVDGAEQALDRLLGKCPGASGRDPDLLESCFSLFAEGEYVTTNVNQAFDEAISNEPRALPSMPRVRAAVEPVEQCRAIAAEFTALLPVMGQHADRLLEWCYTGPVPMASFERAIENEFQRSTRSTAKRGVSTEPLLVAAVSELLDRFGKLARREPGFVGARMMSLYDRLGVFRCRRHLHRYFLSRQGSLWSRCGNDFPTGESLVRERRLILPALGEVISSLRAQILAKPFDRHKLLAFFDLEHLYLMTILRGAPENLPAAIVKPTAAAATYIPSRIQRHFEAPVVASGAVAALFTFYATNLRVATLALARSRIVVRHAFMRARDNALVYAPKTAAWRPPSRLYRTSKPIGAALRCLSREAEAIDPGRLLKRALSAPIAEADVRELLLQSPHAWFYAGPCGGAAVAGLPVSKAGLGKRLTSHASAFRLIGPPSAKNSLDQSLLGGKSSIGDLQLICERHFVQRVEWDGASMQVHVREFDCSLHLGVPLLRQVHKCERPISMHRYLCVELGRTGIGWVAFDARTHKELANGSLSIDSLRSWLASANVREERGHETRHVERLDGIGTARELVAADVMHSIDSLLSKFRAFPVLKMKSRLAARSEIEMIHGIIVEAYAFVDHEIVIRQRRARWSGGLTWTHPYLRRENPAIRKAKPLNLFPGTVVSARGVEQECSRCGRNAVDAVATALGECPGSTFMVSEGGRVELVNGTIILYRRGHGAHGREQHGGVAPYREGPIAAHSLIAAIKETIRAPSPTLPGTRGTGPTYSCPYVTCAARDGAQVNTARNIARRFRESLVQDAN